MQIPTRLTFLLCSASVVVANAAPKSYTKFQSIGFSLFTGPAEAIDKNATNNCEYTPVNCRGEVVLLGGDEVCEACVVLSEECGSVGFNPIISQTQECYIGKSDTAEDVDGRISIMQQAVERAYEVASQDEDTLKIFVAPEFFWRGANGSYSFDVIDNLDKEGEYNAIGHITKALEDMIQQEKFSDWMFLFGTIIASKEETTSEGVDNTRAIETNGTMYQFLNFAPIYKGFDPATTSPKGMMFVVPKVTVSSIDFLSTDRTPKLSDYADIYDNDLFDEISVSLEDTGYVEINESLFYMNNIAMSVEICLDHLEKMAQTRLHDPNITMVSSGGLGKYDNLPKPESAQISLVSSAGMSIMKDSLVLDKDAGGTIFLQDGLNAQHSQEQICEYKDLGGKGGEWFCSDQAPTVHEVYESVEEAQDALQGLFFMPYNTVPEIRLFQPLEIITGGSDDATGDVNTTSDETNTDSDDTSAKSNDGAPSAGTRIMKHQVVSFALIAALLFGNVHN